MDTAVSSRDAYVAEAGILNEGLVRFISKDKKEPEWMLNKRLKALELFKKTPMPKWGPDLSRLEMDKIIFYRKPDAKQASDWEEVPPEIKKTFDALGIPEAEQKALGGAGAQFESSVIYHKLKKEFGEQGVIFEDMDVAVQKYPELVKKYFMTNCIPISDHKFIMLHAAVWSGGTFIYIPRGVKVALPLQAYFRMNAKRGGQFEHTLIIAEPHSEVRYIEGCSAPQFGRARALHAGGVEIYVMEGARVRYSSVENWSTSTFNLNTKRAIVEKNGIIEWVSGNMGSCTTMLYPCSILKGEGARTDNLGIAYAGRGQNQDTGAKVYHLAPNTSSTIKAKSISKNGGVCTYRGLVKVVRGAKNSKVAAVCDALILDPKSVSNTVPSMDIGEESVQISHEARVGKLSTEKIFYLMSRGIKEEDAVQMIVAGFIEPIIKELPLEYAVELNKLIQLEMVGAVG
ncbi:Fe-S cluster assembly protein SufB [Candidatus Woesearchaeota archaeon]|nr:Fe-S cluster assembly protein SufB [Candidatus Woesearchaeota archaeon]